MTTQDVLIATIKRQEQRIDELEREQARLLALCRPLMVKVDNGVFIRVSPTAWGNLALYLQSIGEAALK